MFKHKWRYLQNVLRAHGEHCRVNHVMRRVKPGGLLKLNTVRRE
jgi:hypothetical protein